MAQWSIDSIPTFCITLDRRLDRWKRFQDQPGIQGLNVKRFLGVDGKKIDYMNDSRITLLTKRNIDTGSRRSQEELDSVGGVGCALSHIAIWQWMVDHNQEVCLIFEDDAVVPPDFVERANACLSKSNVMKNSKEWDVWTLSQIVEDQTEIPEEPAASGFVKVDAFVLFHGYVITRTAAERFLKDVYPIHCHIDFWVSIYCFYHKMQIVSCKKLKLLQSGSPTDIQNKKGCAICEVPADFYKTHRLVTHTDWTIAQMSKAVCIGLVAYYAYQRFR